MPRLSATSATHATVFSRASSVTILSPIRFRLIASLILSLLVVIVISSGGDGDAEAFVITIRASGKSLLLRFRRPLGGSLLESMTFVVRVSGLLFIGLPPY